MKRTHTLFTSMPAIARSRWTGHWCRACNYRRRYYGKRSVSDIVTNKWSYVAEMTNMALKQSYTIPSDAAKC